MSMLQKMSELEISEIDLFPARHHPDYIISSANQAKSIKNVSQEKKFVETSKKQRSKSKSKSKKKSEKVIGYYGLYFPTFSVGFKVLDKSENKLYQFFQALSEFWKSKQYYPRSELPDFEGKVKRVDPTYLYFDDDKSLDSTFQKLQRYIPHGSIIFRKTNHDQLIRLALKYRINNPVYNIDAFDSLDEPLEFTPSFWNGKNLPVCLTKNKAGYVQMFAHPEIEVFHPDHFLTPDSYLEEDLYEQFRDAMYAKIGMDNPNVLMPNPFFAPLVGEASKFAFFMDPTPYLNQLAKNCTLGKLPSECFLTVKERKQLSDDSDFVLSDERKAGKGLINEHNYVTSLRFFYTWFQVDGQRIYLYALIPDSYRDTAERSKGSLPAFSIPSYLLLLNANTFVGNEDLKIVHYEYFQSQMYLLDSSSRLAIAYSHPSSLRYWLRKDKCFGFYGEYPITSIDNPAYRQMKQMTM